MKQYIHIIKMIPAALLLCACSETDNLPTNEEESGPQVEEFTASLTSIDTNAEARATVSPYIVNTPKGEGSSPYDPTKTSMETRSNWAADVKIYKGENIYSTHGEATYKYGSSKWEIQSDATLRFPNYLKQKITATFYPENWTSSTTFVTDQSTIEKLLPQDILVEQDPDGTYNPAKSITINMRHANSMLDFIINDIEATNIESVKVKMGEGGTEYTPYKAKTSPVEYLLIIPTTKDGDNPQNPIIEIKTNKNATYRQEIKVIGATNNDGIEIKNYTINTCYCFTLKGLELILSPITVTDWTTGKAVAGDYIAVTAYPTFRGTPNETYYVYYDNCLKDEEGNAKMQKITFNSRGECTIKPDGRIITHLSKDSKFTPNESNKLTTPVLLGTMIVNLNGTIAELTKKP